MCLLEIVTSVCEFVPCAHEGRPNRANGQRFSETTGCLNFVERRAMAPYWTVGYIYDLPVGPQSRPLGVESGVSRHMGYSGQNPSVVLGVTFTLAVKTLARVFARVGTDAQTCSLCWTITLMSSCGPCEWLRRGSDLAECHGRSMRCTYKARIWIAGSR